MKHLLLTTIAAVLVVGCGESQPPEPPPAKAPDISIRDAVKEGNIEAVKQHIAAGTDVNASHSFNGFDVGTPLHLAASAGRKEIVELLIAAGANVNAMTEDRWTPLGNAANKEIAELLIANGADVNTKGARGRTLLHSTANKEIAELLIANGADVNAKDMDSFTPLHFASTKEIAELLITKGADMNAKGGMAEGIPLFMAADKGYNEIAELLIAKGADVNAEDNFGRTPLDKARRHPETADLLRKHGGKTRAELKAEGK